MQKTNDIIEASENGMFSGQASFSFLNRLERALFFLVWKIFASWTPPQLFRWRNFILRLFGAKIANSARIYNSVRIWHPKNMIVGDCSIVGPRVNFYNQDIISIGNYSVVSQDSSLCTGTHDYQNLKFQLITKPITVGDRAWVCAEAFVGPGVTIEEGAILGARGVAVKDIPAWNIYSGNPAKYIKKRNFHP